MVRAYFSYVTSGLTIGFVNLSSGSPDTFLWDFGYDSAPGVPSTSTQENPTFMYPKAGHYSVTLTITQNGTVASTDTVTLSVGVAATGTPLPTTILESILTRLPSSWLPTISTLDLLLKKWQAFLRIFPEPEIEESQCYNELLWPPLVNELILNLIIYDVLQDQMVKLGGAAAAVSGSGGSASSSGSATGGGLKRVVTGPSEAEWFDNATSFSQAVSALAKSGTGSTSGNGFMDQVAKRICTLSARLRIPLEICPDLPHSPVGPKIVHTKATPHHHHRHHS